jgi:hypothetical protein
MSDSYLFDVGWVFFTAWSALVFIVSLAAFGQDLFPALVRSERAQNTGSHEPVNPAESAR